MSYIEALEREQERKRREKEKEKQMQFDKSELKECLIATLKEISETFMDAGGGKIYIEYTEGTLGIPHIVKIAFLKNENITEKKGDAKQ